MAGSLWWACRYCLSWLSPDEVAHRGGSRLSPVAAGPLEAAEFREAGEDGHMIADADKERIATAIRVAESQTIPPIIGTPRSPPPHLPE